MWIPPEPPFVLNAITLRGVGSYLHGARLDIKPLTVLCGANGSGKSTWLKALNFLSDSLAAKRLPFGFAVQDWDHANIQLTNAFCHLEDPAQLAALEDDAATAAYGTMGTIGLEFHATEDTKLGRGPELPNVEDGQAAWQFFTDGTIQSKDRFRLRLAHPTHRDDSAATPTLRHVVELQYNDHHTIRMEGERDPFQKYEEGYTRPRRSKPYTLSCSRSFLTGNDADAGEFIPLAVFHDLIAPKLELQTDMVDENTIVALLKRFEDLIRVLLQAVLTGFFYIGAIRPPMTAVSLQEGVEGTREGNYVGASGENAWSITSRYLGAQMRKIVNTFFAPEEMVAYFIQYCYFRKHFSGVLTDGDGKEYPRLVQMQYIHSCLPEGVRERMEVLADSMDQGFEGIMTRKDDDRVKDLTDVFKLMADAINELLDDRRFFSLEVWGEKFAYLDEDYEKIEDVHIDDREIAALAFRVDELSSKNVRLLNYMLILNAYNFTTPTNCGFNQYLSAWLQRLVKVGLNRPHVPSSDWRRSTSHSYFLDRPTPYLRSRGQLRQDRDSSLARLDHPCFGGSQGGALQPPGQMSSGFHQLFPIFVQLGVMKSGELIGIENPEVHLHPALQVSITEALLDHAVSGRRIIVETHSDLLLRRVIRAILSEEISQSQVQIYFTKLGPIAREGAGAEFSESTLEPIRTDSRGRISNWPEGFLDADVGESKQLMDIMYGGNDHEEPDDVTG